MNPQALKDAEKLMELKPDWPKSFSRKGAAQHALTRYTVGVCGLCVCFRLLRTLLHLIYLTDQPTNQL